MVATFQESVKKIIEWLDTGETSHFRHPYANVKEIEPGQFLVIDDTEPPVLDKNKILITQDVAENLVAKLFGMTSKNSAVVQSIISSTVRQNTGIFIPVGYFNKMLSTDDPKRNKIEQSSKLISSKAIAHISKNQNFKVVTNNSKSIIPSPTRKPAQPAVTNQNRVASPSSIETTKSLPVSTSKASRSVLKSITTQTKNLQNSIPNVTLILSKTGKMVPLAIAAPEQGASVKTPETGNQATPYRIVNIQKQNEPLKTIWNPLTPSPTSSDVMSPEQGSLEATTNTNNDPSMLMVNMDETVASLHTQSSNSEQLVVVPPMTFSNLSSNQVFPASNTNQAAAGTVYRHVTRSPLDGNVFNIPYESSSHSTNRIYVQDRQSRQDYPLYDQANCGFVLKKERDQQMMQGHRPRNTMSYQNML